MGTAVTQYEKKNGKTVKKGSDVKPTTENSTTSTGTVDTNKGSK